MSAADGRRDEGVEIARLRQRVSDARFRAWFAVAVTVLCCGSLMFGLGVVFRTMDVQIETLEARLKDAERARETTYLSAHTERCGGTLIGYMPRDGTKLCLIQDDPSSVALRWGPCAEGGK